jgi:hypothetical protein
MPSGYASLLTCSISPSRVEITQTYTPVASPYSIRTSFSSSFNAIFNVVKLYAPNHKYFGKKPNEETVTGLELTSAGIDHKSLLRVLPGMWSARFRLFLVLDNGGYSTVVPLDDFPSSPSSAARGVQLNRLPSRTGRIQVASIYTTVTTPHRSLTRYSSTTRILTFFSKTSRSLPILVAF